MLDRGAIAVVYVRQPRRRARRSRSTSRARRRQRAAAATTTPRSRGPITARQYSVGVGDRRLPGDDRTYRKETLPASDPQDSRSWPRAWGWTATPWTPIPARPRLPRTRTPGHVRVGGHQDDRRVRATRVGLESVVCTGTSATRAGDAVSFSVSAGAQIVLHLHEHEARLGDAQEDDERGRRSEQGHRVRPHRSRLADAPAVSRSTLRRPGRRCSTSAAGTRPRADVQDLRDARSGRLYLLLEARRGHRHASTTRTRARARPRISAPAATTSRSRPGRRAPSRSTTPDPGGDPRTIGYWKNWNRCTGGNQAATAQKNGGAAAGFFLVEDLLPQRIGDFTVTSCQQAVKLLSKQDQAGKSKSSDAAYELGAQLLAARFNLAAGAETLPGRAAGGPRRADAPRPDQLHRLRRLPRLEVEGRAPRRRRSRSPRRSTATTTATSAEAQRARRAIASASSTSVRPRRSSTVPRACSSRSTRLTVAREVPAISASCSCVSGITESRPA